MQVEVELAKPAELRRLKLSIHAGESSLWHNIPERWRESRIALHSLAPMLDLKAKLASAGLVSQADIDRVDAKKNSKGKGKKGKGKKGKSQVRPLDVGLLKKAPIGEFYDGIRRWVSKARLDRQGGVPSEHCKPFHFPEIAGKIGRLTIEPKLAQQLQSGEAAVIAFMSNSGLAHAVVPAAGARDIATLKEEWLRFLPSDPRAGKIIKG